MTGIKKNDDFSRVYREGRSCADRRLVMYVLDSAAGDENEVPANRLGISVSKKVGICEESVGPCSCEKGI